MTILDRFRLDGRVALVTGASQGLGKAIARGFAEAGADVVIASRNEAALNDAMKEILDGTSSRGHAVVADVGQREAADQLVRACVDTMGQLDIIVCNAGRNIPQNILEVTDSTWDELQEVFVGAAMALTRAAAPHMMERGWGRVIFTSSILAHQPLADRAAYAAAKAALIGLAKACAVDLAPAGITANVVIPGGFKTEALVNLSPEQLELASQASVFGRLGDPDELVGAYLLLASDAGSYITGTELVVDGGWLSH